jgi:hypothetical protein
MYYMKVIGILKSDMKSNIFLHNSYTTLTIFYFFLRSTIEYLESTYKKTNRMVDLKKK